VRQVMAALEEVEGYHAVEASLQSKQYLEDIRGHLSTMIHIDHVRWGNRWARMRILSMAGN
jgi:Hereditary spastic paraplegia protein strumpellin